MTTEGQNPLSSLVLSKSDEVYSHFPSDERVRELTSQACKEELEFCELEEEEKRFVIEELKIPDLVMPSEFRNSVFNSSFKVRKVASTSIGSNGEGELEVSCGFCANFNGNDFEFFKAFMDIGEIKKGLPHPPTFRPQRKCNAWLPTGKRCEEKAVFRSIDLVLGLNDRSVDNFYCGSCCGFPLLAGFLSQVIPKEVGSLITKFLSTPATLEDWHSGNTKFTSSLYDWVCFMYLDAEEGSKNWLINANPTSKLYGWVLGYCHQGELELISHVSQFSRKDFLEKYLAQEMSV